MISIGSLKSIIESSQNAKSKNSREIKTALKLHSKFSIKPIQSALKNTIKKDNKEIISKIKGKTSIGGYDQSQTSKSDISRKVGQHQEVKVKPNTSASRKAINGVVYQDKPLGDTTGNKQFHYAKSQFEKGKK